MLIVTFLNDATGNKNIGNYDVAVRANTRIIYQTRITNHKRQEGWRSLLRRLLKEAK